MSGEGNGRGQHPSLAVVASSWLTPPPSCRLSSEPEPAQTIRPSYVNAGLALLARQAGGPSLMLPSPSSSTSVKHEPTELNLPGPSKPRPPPKPKTITDIFPDFKHGQILDFVDMFACGIQGKNKATKPTRGGDKAWDLTSGTFRFRSD